MNYELFNPLTGKNAPGPRFCFRVHSIGHRILHLPITMRKQREVEQLMGGLSPLEVFSCDSIQEARQAFYKFRMLFDFPYWAALNFKVHDVSSGEIIPLILNRHQRWLAEIFLNPRFMNPSRKYLISKTIPRCGLTTVVQAYFFWMQTRYRKTSITFAATSAMKEVLMKNAVRSICRDADYYNVYIGKYCGNPNACAKFHQADSKGVFENVPCAYIHLSDMSQWLDPRGRRTSEILSASLKEWCGTPASYLILEGDLTSHPGFRMEDHNNSVIPESYRLMGLGDFCRNSYFMNEVLKKLSPEFHSDFFYIDLDKAP